MTKEREEEARRAAEALSDDVIYFAAIKLMAYATSGEYHQTNIPELPGMEAIRRWEQDKLRSRERGE